MTGGFEFRDIADQDIAAVVALWDACGLLRPWNDPFKDIAFARRYQHSTVRVGVEAGEIITTAMIGEDGHRGWAYYVAVRPDRQSAGLGRAVMNDAERWLAARGVWKVQLLVRAENVAVAAFYEKLGYQDTGTVCLQKRLDQ